MPTQGMSRGRRVLRAAIGVVLLATCVRVWIGPIEWMPRAEAQIPNAGSQRADLIQEVRHTNQLLGEVLSILRSKAIKVEIQGLSGATGTGKTSPPPAPTRPSPQK